jgi:hypothetical protein
LKILTYPFDSPLRAQSSTQITEICAEINKKLNGSISPNGNDGSFWVSRTFWDVRESVDAVTNANLLHLGSLIHDRGAYLAPDQLENLYQRLLCKARDAALAEWGKTPEQKKIKYCELSPWFEEALRQMQHPASKGIVENLTRKMTEAGLPTDYLETAIEQRIAYRKEYLSPRYLSLGDPERIAQEVAAYLHHLRSELDTECIDDTGPQFHHRCLETLKAVQQRMQTGSQVPLNFLQGCMYDMTSRCVHRFVRIGP